MEKIIEGLRDKGERVMRLIESDSVDFEKIYGKQSKDFKNRYLTYRLAEPISYNDVQDYSMGFIELYEEDSSLFINEDKLQLKAEEIFKKRIETLRRTLLNKEMNFITLRSILELNGYWNMLDDKVEEDIKNCFKVFYPAVDSSEEKIEIVFEIIEDAEVDVTEENFRLKVTGIKRI